MILHVSYGHFHFCASSYMLLHKKTYPSVDPTSIILSCHVLYSMIKYSFGIQIIYCTLYYTVIKGYRFSRPQPGCHQPRPVIIKLFPARESSVSDIPSRDRKIMYLFSQCTFFWYILSAELFLFLSNHVFVTVFKGLVLMKNWWEVGGGGYCLVSSDRPNSLTR